MKKFTWAAFAAMAVISSCQVEEPYNNDETQCDNDKFYATICDEGSSKTVMDDNNNIRWSAGDQLVIFKKNSLGLKYQIQEAYVDETSGYFSKVTSSAGSDDFGAGMSIDHNIAYYPYSSDVKFAKSGNDYTLKLSLPSEQTYASESFGNGAFPMAAVSADTDLAFKNVGGGIKLQLKGTCKVESIVIEGNNGELLSGAAVVTVYADEEKVPSIAMAENAETFVTLNCGNGVQLDENTATEFIISLPPTIFTKGFTVTVTDTDGGTQIIETSKENEVVRSSLLKMPEVEVKTESNEVPYNQIWYTATEKVEPNMGGILSNNYDPITKRGVITFCDEVAIGEEAFSYCTSLTSIKLPSCVHEIGYAAFQGCSSLTSFDIPPCVNYIPARAFSDCKALTSISLHPAVVWLGEETFMGCESLKDIDLSYVQDLIGLTFVGCYSLTNVDISKVDYVAPYVFTDCKSLTTVRFSPSLKCIGESAFAYTSITTLNLPDSVTRIDYTAFDNCNSLIEVNIPSSVTYLASGAFSNCKSLKKVTLDIENTEIHDNPFTLCPNLEKINNGRFLIIDNELRSVAVGGITELHIPSGITSIGTSACQGCNSLTNILIPDTVTNIGACAFQDCKNICEIVIPKNVESIEQYAFNGCDNLWTVFCKAYIPPDINWFTFEYCSDDLKIYVPEGCVAKYKTKWRNYDDIIYEIVEEDNITNLSETGTANSYIVSEAGSYKFTPTKGNSNKSVGSIASVEVLWETFGTDETPNVGDVIRNAKFEGGRIRFDTPDKFKEGNALIAAKDANGTILWSWHIWLTDQPEGQVYYNDAGTMMDRNLGATSATPGDVGALGLLYQWGRKDPFLGSSSISEKIEVKSTISWPSTVSSNFITGTIAYATLNPTTFINGNRHNNDWYYTESSTTDNTRWATSDKAKSIYDPCPAGWRVPDGGSNGVWSKALGVISLDGYIYRYPYDITNKGINFSGKFGSASAIWYPGGSYWSASTNSKSAYYLYNGYLAGDNGILQLSSTSSRSSGCSVRCVQE